jgi:hypothetical protein
MEYDSDQKTAFNIAIASLMRVNNLLIEANYYSRLNQPEIWRATLNALFREVYPKLEETQIEGNKKKKIKGFRDIITEVSEAERKYANAQANNEEAVPRRYNELYKALDEYERALRKAMDKKGMLITNAEDAAHAVLNG